MSEKKFVNIIMPENDEGTESFIEKWLKSVGEFVTENEPLVEINTDKVSIEIPAPNSGVLTKINKNDNDQVTAGDVLGVISNQSIVEKKRSRKNSINRKAAENCPRNIFTRIPPKSHCATFITKPQFVT